MMAVTAAKVKELRALSGAGMMDCKKALTESAGDMDGAVDWLRTKGLAAATKKSGRAAAEGLIGVSVSADGKSASLVEVNAETDFVARNEQFQKYVESVAARVTSDDVADVAVINYPHSDRNIGDELTHMISVIGENMHLRRAASVSVTEGAVAAYMHSAVREGLGRIGVVVGLTSKGDTAKLAALAKNIAMHIAASKPVALTREGIEAAAVERERVVLKTKAEESGRPADIIEKMVDGGIRKYYAEVVLMEQLYILDPKKKIEDVVADLAKELGEAVTLTNYAYFVLGDGIEKKEEDFAAEVAATMGRSS